MAAINLPLWLEEIASPLLPPCPTPVLALSVWVVNIWGTIHSSKTVPSTTEPGTFGKSWWPAKPEEGLYTQIHHEPVAVHSGPGPVLALHLGVYELTGAGLWNLWYSLWYICDFLIHILSYMMAKHNSTTSLDFPLLTWGQGDTQLSEFLFRGITWGILMLCILPPLSRIVRTDLVCHGYCWKLMLICSYSELLTAPPGPTSVSEHCCSNIATQWKMGNMDTIAGMMIYSIFTGQMTDLPE